MLKSHNELMEIFDELKIEILELHEIERGANNKFIRELMKELTEAYNTIESLTASLEAFRSLSTVETK